jgi:RNA polymerase sigma factor (sigma-70 family)
MLTEKDRNLLVENYIPLAKKLAYLKAKNLPKRVDVEELKSAAYYGLVDASRHFDPEKSSSFGPYARCRIWGEINDCVRYLSWGKKTRRITVCNVDFTEESEPAVTQDNEFENSDLCDTIMSQIENKFAREMVYRYYICGHKLKDIAKDNDLSIGRISQIIKETMAELRSQHTGAAA